jgi:hypothetical protein
VVRNHGTDAARFKQRARVLMNEHGCRMANCIMIAGRRIVRNQGEITIRQQQVVILRGSYALRKGKLLRRLRRRRQYPVET